MAGYRADVTSLYDRLGADVSTLAPGDDDVSRQALADAAERYNATGALLAHRRHAGRVRGGPAHRGRGPGRDAARAQPARASTPGPRSRPRRPAPQLLRRRPSRSRTSTYSGSPRYTPGRPHYWGGGQIGRTRVPGGWYGVDFGSLILGGVLGGMLGGGGDGYDRGYRDGSDSRGWGGGGGGGGWSAGATGAAEAATGAAAAEEVAAARGDRGPRPARRCLPRLVGGHRRLRHAHRHRRVRLLRPAGLPARAHRRAGLLASARCPAPRRCSSWSAA